MFSESVHQHITEISTANIHLIGRFLPVTFDIAEVAPGVKRVSVST